MTGPPFSIWRLKSGNDAADAVQHVAEPHGDELRLAGAADGLANKLRNALADAHDVRGPDRLVRGHHDEFSHPVHLRVMGDQRRPADVVPQGLDGVQLHERDMLVGRGVEHHFGHEFGEGLLQTVLIQDVADDRAGLELREQLHEVHLDLIEIELRVFEQNKAFRRKMRNLAAELGADGPPGARDHNGLVPQIFPDPVVLSFTGSLPRRSSIRNSRSELTFTAPLRISPTAGRVFDLTPALLHVSMILRLAFAGAEGSAIRISSTFHCFTILRISRVFPMTWYPWMVICRLDRSSSTNPTGLYLSR